MNKNNNPVSVYAAVSQIAFLVAVPLLFFIWGGSWLIKACSLPQWLMIVFVLLGIVTMVAGVSTYLRKLLKMYAPEQKDENSALKHDRRDSDY